MSHTINVKSGEKFQIPLTGSAGTGFRWEVELSEVAARHVTLISTEREAASTVPGGPTTQRFQFQALLPGDVALTFRQRRPWEAPTSGTLQTIAVHIDPA